VPKTLTLTDAEVRTLDERGWLLRDDVLGHRAAMAISHAVGALAAGGRLRPAGVSRGPAYRVDSTVRGDAIAWLDADEASPELAALREVFLSLRDALNRGAYLGLDRIEIQVARYPGDGSGYARHRDSFRALPGPGPSRRVTAIYYANPGWCPDHGGMLRLHVDGGPHDLEPLLDRLLVFLSERVEHEVLPARAARQAITAWFLARDPLGR
jgi:SM-20-related protein